VAHWGDPCDIDALGEEAQEVRRRFWRVAADDLGLPSCLAILWSLARREHGFWGRTRSVRDLPANQKAALARDFDRLLALDLGQPATRRAADRLRGSVSSPTVVGRGAATCTVSVNVLVQTGEDLAAVERSVHSVLRCTGGCSVEVVVVDATGSPEAHATLAVLAQTDARIRLVWLDHDPGAAAGRNAGLRASTGDVIALMDASVELLGDALQPLVLALEDPSVGAAGPYGLVTDDMRHYFEVPDETEGSREVDALQNYLLAFRRADLERIGWLDEHFRFYRSLDLDLSYTIRDRVGRAVGVTGLPLTRHRHTLWESLAEGDREERSRKNFGRFLKRWDHRHDLHRAEGHHDVEHLKDGHAALHG
jgi:hypothetical protein